MRIILRNILLTMAAIIGMNSASANEAIDSQLRGIWKLPFTFKHNDEPMKGNIYLEFLLSEHEVRLTESFTIGATANAAFKAYSGRWRADGSRLAVAFTDKSDIQWTSAVYSRLEQAGLDDNIVSEVITAVGNSFPNLSRIGFGNHFNIRSVTATELRLSSESSRKTLVFKKVPNYPKGTLPTFTASPRMEKALNGSWVSNMFLTEISQNAVGMLTFDRTNHMLQMSLSMPELEGLIFNFSYKWRASDKALYHSYIPGSISLTSRDDPSLQLDPSNFEEIQQLETLIDVISIFNNVIGCQISINGNKLTIGGCGPNKPEIYTRVTQANNSRNASAVTTSQTAISSQAKDEPKTSASAPQKLEIFSNVEQMPQFPGGDQALQEYISSHLQYPSGTEQSDTERRVVVKFVVMSDGTIGDAYVSRGKSPELDQEAIRVVKSLPNFTPGKMNGTPVNVWYTLPISF